jgi:hypothetical protein
VGGEGGGGQGCSVEESVVLGLRAEQVNNPLDEAEVFQVLIAA